MFHIFPKYTFSFLVNVYQYSLDLLWRLITLVETFWSIYEYNKDYLNKE